MLFREGRSRVRFPKPGHAGDGHHRREGHASGKFAIHVRARKTGRLRTWRKPAGSFLLPEALEVRQILRKSPNYPIADHQLIDDLGSDLLVPPQMKRFARSSGQAIASVTKASA